MNRPETVGVKLARARVALGRMGVIAGAIGVGGTDGRGDSEAASAHADKRINAQRTRRALLVSMSPFLHLPFLWYNPIHVCFTRGGLNGWT